jgi:trans-aconitate methyltransferase
MTDSTSHIVGTGGTWCPEWDGNAYAANTGHHRAQDDAFFASCPLRPADRVLDLGCGAGDFTRAVADRVPDGLVVGVDPQPSMLEEATARASANQRFVCGTAQQLDAALGGEAPFDVVVSRAVLHWIPAADTPTVYRQVHDCLRPGGWFRFECGGAGNIAASLAIMDAESAERGGPRCPWHFAPAERALDTLEQAGFDVRAGFVRLVAQRRTFTRDEVVGWLRSQVLLAYTETMAPDVAAAFTAAVERRIDELRRWDGTFDQTWVRLDALVQRAA